jgi:cobalt transporter subunit CbtA
LTAVYRIVLAALVAGAIAGLAAAAIQSVTTWPLIRAAETYETPHHDHDGAIEEEDAPPAAALTVLTDVLAGIGYALLLAGGIVLSGARVDAARGALWGLAGFAAFSLAPALGLPPEPPGAAEADLAARQLWWALTAACTAAGLALIAFRRNWIAIAAAVALIVVPHIVGAPAPEGASTVPPDLARKFVVASLGSSAIFWLVLGVATGWITERFNRA